MENSLLLLCTASLLFREHSKGHKVDIMDICLQKECIPSSQSQLTKEETQFEEQK